MVQVMKEKKINKYWGEGGRRLRGWGGRAFGEGGIYHLTCDRKELNGNVVPTIQPIKEKNDK